MTIGSTYGPRARAVIKAPEGLRKLHLIATLLLLAALPAPAGAGPEPQAKAAAGQYDYVAETATAAIEQGSVTVNDLEWQCSCSRCLISGPWPLPGLGACKALASRVGRIVSYGHAGRSLSPEQLDQCNQGARSTAAVSPGGNVLKVVSEGALVVEAFSRRLKERLLPAALTSGSFYKLVNKNSGRALAVGGGSTVVGTGLIQWSDHGQEDILWQAVPAEAGHYVLKNKKSNLLLAVESGSVESGARLIQSSDPGPGAGREPMLWKPEVADNSFYRLVNKRSGRFIAVSGGSSVDGAAIVQWHNVGQADLLWRLEEQTIDDEPAGTLRCRASVSNELAGALDSREKEAVRDGFDNLDALLEAEPGAGERVRLRGDVHAKLVDMILSSGGFSARAEALRGLATAVFANECAQWDMLQALRELAASGVRYEPTPADVAIGDRLREVLASQGGSQ